MVELSLVLLRLHQKRLSKREAITVRNAIVKALDVD